MTQSRVFMPGTSIHLVSKCCMVERNKVSKKKERKKERKKEHCLWGEYSLKDNQIATFEFSGLYEISDSSPVCPCLSRSVPACPGLSRPVPACPVLSRSVPVCPGLSRPHVQPLMRFLCCPQKIFGAEMRSVPSGDLSLGDGDAGPGPGLPPQLLHLHHLQQDAHHRGPLWHEGQPGVLPAAL